MRTQTIRFDNGYGVCLAYVNISAVDDSALDTVRQLLNDAWLKYDKAVLSVYGDKYAPDALPYVFCLSIIDYCDIEVHGDPLYALLLIETLPDAKLAVLNK